MASSAEWDINDSVVPRIANANDLNEFTDWPDGHCRRIYAANNEDVKKHMSGWAMRNTNNHNVNILKKSCLGVILCSERCVPSGGNKIQIRPAICDKARKKQRDRPCPNSECNGHLIIQQCRGHCGYPVTHFWRSSGSEVYFQAKGTHDHPQPEPKGSHQTKHLYTKRKSTALITAGGIDKLKRRTAVSAKLRSLRAPALRTTTTATAISNSVVQNKGAQPNGIANDAASDAYSTWTATSAAFQASSDFVHKSQQHTHQQLQQQHHQQQQQLQHLHQKPQQQQHYQQQQLQPILQQQHQQPQLQQNHATQLHHINHQQTTQQNVVISPSHSNQTPNRSPWIDYSYTPSVESNGSQQSVSNHIYDNQCSRVLSSSSMANTSASGYSGDCISDFPRPEEIFHIDQPIVRSTSAQQYAHYAPSNYSNGMSPTSTSSTSSSPPCTFLDLESGRIQQSGTNNNQQLHSNHPNQQQQFQQQQHHHAMHSDYNASATTSAANVKFESYNGVYSDDTASISNEFDETYLCFQQQVQNTNDYGVFFGASSADFPQAATPTTTTFGSGAQNPNQQQQQQNHPIDTQHQHHHQTSFSSAYAAPSPGFDLLTGAVDWSNAFGMQHLEQPQQKDFVDTTTQFRQRTTVQDPLALTFQCS